MGFKKAASFLRDEIFQYLSFPGWEITITQQTSYLNIWRQVTMQMVHNGKVHCLYVTATL